MYPSPSRYARLVGYCVLSALAVLATGPGFAAARDEASGTLAAGQLRAAPARLQPAGPGPQSSGRSGPGGPQGPWWSDAAIKAEIGLTEEQSRRIKDIFEKREAEIKPLADMLGRESDRLDRMTRERTADEVTYAVQVAKVESLYGRLRESRTMMIYRMFRELQPEQHQKLQEILARRRGGGRGPGSR